MAPYVPCHKITLSIAYPHVVWTLPLLWTLEDYCIGTHERAQLTFRPEHIQFFNVQRHPQRQRRVAQMVWSGGVSLSSNHFHQMWNTEFLCVVLCKIVLVNISNFSAIGTTPYIKISDLSVDIVVKAQSHQRTEIGRAHV